MIFNPHSKGLIPCFSLMCVNCTDSVCKMLSPVIRKRTNEITSALSRASINTFFPSCCSFASQGHRWLVLRLKLHGTIEKWWQPDLALSSYPMSKTGICNRETVFIPVINTKFHILNQTFLRNEFRTNRHILVYIK